MSENRKTDNLKEDPPLSGQDWTVVSFVAPEDMVAKKKLHYVNNFMVSDINKTISAQATQMAKYLSAKLNKNLSDVLDKLSSSVDEDDKRVHDILKRQMEDIVVDEDEYVNECRRKYELDDQEIMDRYKVYVTENRQKMDREFDEAYDHVTSVRGIKVRGCFQRYEEARKHAKLMRDNVEPAIHAFVAPVGKWLPLDIDADEAQEQEYNEKALQDLMGKYHEGVHARNAHYADRKREMEDTAQRNNKMTAREHAQQVLRERRNKKMKAELEALKMAGDEDAGFAELKKSKKKKRKNKKKETNIEKD